MDGLKPGRIVYLVISAQMADEIMRRRTSGSDIAARMKTSVPSVDGDKPSIYGWPEGAQAHIGNPVDEGDIVPAMVVRIFGDSPNVNLKAMLDGSDTFWATSVPFDESKALGSWHWMFDGQQKRYDATTVQR